MAFSQVELQALSAKAEHEYNRTGDRLKRAALLDLQVSVDYLEELLGRDQAQQSLFDGAAV